jgi:hypothetical protein
LEFVPSIHMRCERVPDARGFAIAAAHTGDKRRYAS